MRNTVVGGCIARRALIMLAGGAAAIWTLAAGAQQPMPVIGYLGTGSPATDNARRLVPFRKGLSETGYVEGQNVTIEYRWAQGQNDRMPTLAADLVRRQVAVITGGSTPPALAAKAATSTIPIVFNVGIDPVEFGLVASFNRPGGNVTGIASLSAELAAKQLELLHELVPSAAVIAVLINPTNPAANKVTIRNLQEAASSFGLHLRMLPATTATEIDAAFATLAELRAGGLVVTGDQLFTNGKDQILALSARHAVPAIYQYREFVTAGGLMSYGHDFADGWRQVGVMVGKILKGAKPADLPVQRVVKIELAVNLKTAKVLGLTIPLPMLARADEVID